MNMIQCELGKQANMLLKYLYLSVISFNLFKKLNNTQILMIIEENYLETIANSASCQ